MKDFVEVSMVFCFPEDIEINTYRTRKSVCPFPSKGSKILRKTNCIHDIGAHNKRRSRSFKNIFIFSLFVDLGGQIGA